MILRKNLNVYDKYPEIAKQMEELADKARFELGDRLTGLRVLKIENWKIIYKLKRRNFIKKGVVGSVAVGSLSNNLLSMKNSNPAQELSQPGNMEYLLTKLPGNF